MSGKQESLIYVENENKAEAEFMSRSFVKTDVKNRAYINALGAELVMKYLASDGIDVENTHNLHSISKILENTDVSDIMLPNIHIDVRVVFDEDKIFIPKQQFNLEITPDIYVVLKLSTDFSYMEFLGFFEPKIINLKNQNDDYYFIEKNKLSATEKLTPFVKNFAGNTSRGISPQDMLRGRELSVSLNDHNISSSEFKELLELLLLSDELRDSILEFDNFETLSNSVGPLLNEDDSSEGDDSVVNSAILADADSDKDDPIDLTSLPDDNNEMEFDESFFNMEESEEPEQTDLTPSQEEDAIETTISDVEDNATDETLSDELTTYENSLTDIEEENNLPAEDIIDPNGDSLLEEDLLSDDLESIQETSLTETIEPEQVLNTDVNSDEEEPTKNPSPEKAVDGSVQNALQKTAETVTGIAATGALASAAASVSEDISVASTASKNAMKLAGVSGDIVNDLINQNLESQQKTLDKIDYSKSGEQVSNIPENIAAYDLSVAKFEANIEAEASGKFEKPTDLTNLKPVQQDKIEEKFEPETVDMEKMETVEVEKFEMKDDGIVDLEKISNINSPTKPIANLEEKILNGTLDQNTKFVDLPTFSLDADSPLDNLNLSIDEPGEEHLVDMGITTGIDLSREDISIEGSQPQSSTEENLVPADGFSVDLFSEDKSTALETQDSTMPELEIDETSLSDESLTLENDDIETPVEETLDTSVAESDETLSIEDDNLEQIDDTEENIVDETSLTDESLTLESDDIETPVEETLDTSVAESDETLSIEDDNLEQIDDTEENIVDENQTTAVEDELPKEEISDEDLNITEDENNTNQIEEETGTSSVPENTSEISEADNTISENTQNIDIEQSKDDEILIDETPEILSNSDDKPMNVDFDISEFQNEDETSANNAEITTSSNQDWMNDTNYDNLQDVEIPQPEEIIVEPDNEDEVKTFAVVENSTMISDSTFNIGEIPIDINHPQKVVPEGPAQLESLYDEDANVPGAALLKNPGRLGSRNDNQPKQTPNIAVGLGIVGVIATLIIIGIIGFSVSRMIKQPTSDTPQPITDDNTSTGTENGVNNANTLNVDKHNVVNMPSDNTMQSPLAQSATPKPVATSTKKSVPATSYIEVNKLSWEVPDYISYNSQFRQYFQSVGKSLKLSLNSDLLLATDYAYSDQVRVSLTYAKDGTFKDAKILLSSGSSQIDNIVLQTVNQTLKVLKAPHSLANDESTTVILKIYF